MIILSVDFGDSRTGIAVCDKLEMLASPVTVIHSRYYPDVLRQTAQIAKEHGAERIVVGYPKNMNGTIGERAKLSEVFAEELRSRFAGVAVVLWDERLSTVAAERVLIDADLQRKKRRKVIDMMAAVVILQNYLDGKNLRSQKFSQ